MSGTKSMPQGALLPRALNVADGATAPDWIELIPSGGVVTGVDGRSWANPDPQAVADRTNAANRPIVVDWEHATEYRAPNGLDAPAAAWIDKVEVRDGAIWGHVEWTGKAANQVAAKEYRFISPVFTHAKAAPHPIHRIVNVGLTNTPNLTLKALNRAEGLNPESPEQTLDLAKLREALGLPADASDDAILAAAREGKATNRQAADTVDLTRYAPRTDLDAAVARATNAESRLAAREAADVEAAIETALNRAQTAGKITPASRPAYLAMCKQAGGLAAFEALEATLPVIAGADSSHAQNKPEKQDGASGLTETQLAVCRALGQDPAEFAKSLKEEAA